MAQSTPLPPQFWRATVSQKPEELLQHPSLEDMASLEGGEEYGGSSRCRRCPPCSRV